MGEGEAQQEPEGKAAGRRGGPPGEGIGRMVYANVYPSLACQCRIGRPGPARTRGPRSTLDRDGRAAGVAAAVTVTAHFDSEDRDTAGPSLRRLIMTIARAAAACSTGGLDHFKVASFQLEGPVRFQR